MIRKSLFLLCSVILAIALAGCSSKPESSAPSETPLAPTALPATLPATETPALPPTNTPLPVVEPSATVLVEPTATGEPASTPTDIPLPPSSPTPSGPVIAPIQSGQAITILMIRMLDASAGWAVGRQGQGSDHVFTTADGGLTWRDVTPPEPIPAQGALSALGFFADARTAWVTYSSQDGMSVPGTAVVWRTQDGGQSWAASAPLDLEGLNEIFWVSDLVFTGAQDGWLLAHVGVGMNHDYVALFRTADGGQTWARLIDPYGDSGIQGCQKTGLAFPSAQIGWLTGDCNGVMAGAFLFQTVDGGQTWQPVTLPPPAEAPGLFTDQGSYCGTRSPVFFSVETGKLIVQCSDYSQDPPAIRYYLYTTHDGGSTWASAFSPAGSLAFLTEDTGWALDRDLFHTADGGQTWVNVKQVNWDGQFSFVDDSLGWAVASAASDSGMLVALVQTTDGGQTWTEIHPVTGP